MESILPSSILGFLYFASFLCEIMVLMKKNFHFLIFSIYSHHNNYLLSVMENTILPLVTEFWTGLGITVTSLTVDVIWDDINIRVETPDSALLIGMHGKNIEAFQHLLSRMIDHQTSTFVHVHLEVNDYMKQKEEKLMRLIDSRIALVQSSGQPIRLPGLTPYERKKAHSYIADRQIVGLSTQSEGEWADRALVLSYTGSIVSQSSQTSAPLPPASPATTESPISDDGVGI